MKFGKVNDGFCDKCKSKIVDSMCDCGIWLAPSEKPEYLLMFETAMTAYDRMDIDYPITCEKIITGTCVVLFKGDYELCEKVKEYIETLENQC